MFNNEERRHIRIGMTKGRRDVAKVEQHEIDHKIRHEANPDYHCLNDEREFWDHLSEDVDMNNDFEKAGYAHIVDRYKRRWLKKNPRPESEKQPEILPELNFVPIELTGRETREEVFARIIQAAANQAAFSDLVSETGMEPDSTTSTTTEEGKQ